MCSFDVMWNGAYFFFLKLWVIGPSSEHSVSLVSEYLRASFWSDSINGKQRYVWCVITILIWIYAWVETAIFFNLFIGILCWFFYGFMISNKMHCSYGTFATGGCDGIVNVWDGNNKKRLYQVRHGHLVLYLRKFSSGTIILKLYSSCNLSMRSTLQV